MKIKKVTVNMPESTHKKILVEKAKRIPRMSVNGLVVEACERCFTSIRGGEGESPLGREKVRA